MIRTLCVLLCILAACGPVRREDDTEESVLEEDAGGCSGDADAGELDGGAPPDAGPDGGPTCGAVGDACCPDGSCAGAAGCFYGTCSLCTGGCDGCGDPGQLCCARAQGGWGCRDATPTGPFPDGTQCRCQ